MKRKNVSEAVQGPVIAFCWGRFQPPHLGHAEVFKKLANIGTAGFYICTSQTKDPQKNPLDYDVKCQFIREIFPQYSHNVLEDKSVKTIYDAIVAIYNRMDPEEAKNTTLTFVGDPERCAQFGPGFRQYNGQQMRTGFYQFKDVTTFENTDAADIRATDVRAAVKENNMQKFQQLTGVKGKLAETMFQAVAEGMNAPAPAKKTKVKESAIAEAIGGDDMLKIFHQTHHEKGQNPEMEKYIQDHSWGVKMLQPDQLPDEDDDVYYDDPFRRVVDIDSEHVGDVMGAIRRGIKIDPIIMGPGKSIIDGNHRAQAARKLRTSIQAYVPMAQLDELEPASEEVLQHGKDMPAPSIKGLAEKYRVTLPKINHALGKGIKVEFDRSGDIDGAREVALRNLNQDLHYYEKTKNVEGAVFNMGNKIIDRATAVNPDDVGPQYAWNMDGEQVLDEVNLKAIQGFANDPRLDDVKMGWELEMIWPDHDDGRHSDDDEYESESEPDWDADEGINHSSVGSFRRDISNFFVGDHNSTRDVRGALDNFLEDYREHLAEKWNELYDDEDEETRDEVASHMEDGKDEDTAKDEARDEWISNNEDEMLEDYIENDRGITSMLGFMNEGPGDLNWPYWTEHENYGYGGKKGSLTREDLKNMFIDEFGNMLRQDGYRVEAINSPHKNKRLDTWYFEPDGSLSPQDRDEGGVELTTPPIPYKRSMEYLEKVFAWAKSNRAWTGTDGDTGFHMSFSLPMEQMHDVDWVKMILMGGDDRVLRDFDRWANGENGWAKSALKHIRTATANGGDINSDMIIKAIRDGLTPDAKREAMKYMSRNKYTSVHPKKPDDLPDDSPDYTYVEFRSAGGDALGQLDKVKTAALQYARSIILAADPAADRQEYAKKLYKLVSKVKADEPGLRALKDFADGKIDKETLKFKLGRAAVARGQQPKYQPAGNIYVFKTTPGGRSGQDIEIIAPTLMAAIPKAQAEARRAGEVPSYYYYLAMEPDERMFRVETENGIGPTVGGFSQEKRAGVIVLATNGAEAAETAAQLLGLPVIVLRVSDVTKGMDLDDLARFETARWNTKEQIAAAKAAQDNAAAELAKAAAAQDNAQPAASSAEQPEEPRSVFSRDTQQPAAPQPNPAATQAGTFIITYLNTTGAQHQTAFDANSVNDAAQSFFAMHPRTYTIVSVVPHQEGQQTESLFNTLMGKSSVIDEEEVDEVNMSPGALADFAKTDAAKRIRVGWEAEMLVPDMSDSEPQWDDDLEPNWDENRTIRFDRNWRTQIQDFWRDGDYNSESRRSIERAIEEMDEQYGEHVSDQFADYLDSEEGIAALMASIRENEAGTEDLSDEEISELDDYANFLESATDDVRDRWTSEYMADDSNFIDWAKDNSLDDMIGFSNRFELSWPYQTPVSGGGSLSMHDLADEFSRYSGFPCKVGSYSTSPDDTTSIFKPDSSIKVLDLPSNYSGVEFASAFKPLPQSMDMLQKFYKWASDIGAETNESCGFHMGISIPDQNSSNVDVLKFVLFLGDNKVLKDFGREASTWTKSTIDKMKSMSLTGGNKYESALAAMKQGLNAAATAQIKNTALPVSSDRGGDRYMSVNYKSDYIEVRSAGGNVFEMKDKILETMNRYVRVLALAADPEAEKQEYAKKLYKLLSTGVPGEEDTIRYFSQYAAGTLPSTALKSFVRQAQRKRADKNKPAASDWTIYKILRRADDFEVHEFLATDAIQAQETLERWARAGGMDSENYTVVKANQQPNQQSQDDDIDFGTWEPEPEPQRPTGPNTWSPNARIAYQLLDRTGRAIAYFTDGTRMPTNSLFYAANSDDAGRRAADLDRVHGLPMGYLVRPFGRNESTEPRSLSQSSIARAILAEEEEEIVDEVVMNPSAFQAFLGTEAAAKMTMGFEAEMCVKNLDTSRGGSAATPRIPEDVDIAAVYPFDPAGQKRYREFWTQEDANTEDAVASALERLKARMDQWMSTHAEGEQITSDHWKRFLRGGGYRRWENMAQVNEVLGLRWPYGNENNQLSRNDLKNDFTASTGYEAVMFSGYHSAEKPKDKFVFEFDSSIRPNPGDGAQELVSYAMPLPQAIEALDKMFAWANEKGYVYANGSTGFHVNVGMTGNTPDKIDTLKLLMLMGDQKILQEFGRESNTYCESMMGRVVRQLKGGYTGQSGRDELLQSIKTKTWDGLRKLASKYVNRAQSGDKFVSVNNKGKYIEFRGPGGDWMSQQAKMRNTILQVSRAYAMAADPVEGQQDYLKKVYKLLSGMDENKKDDRLQVFADWSMGKISNEALTNQLRARQGKPTQAAAQAAAQPASTNTPPASSVVDTGEYSEAILSRLPPQLANAQGWILLDDDGDEVDSFTATAREAISMGMDQSERNPEYTYSLESESNGRTFATFSSGGRVYYSEWVVVIARANGIPVPATQSDQQPDDDDEENIDIDLGDQEMWGSDPENFRITYQDGNDRGTVDITAGSQREAEALFRSANPGVMMSGIARLRESIELAEVTQNPAVWDVWFMHQDPDDEEPSEIRNRVRADSAQAAMAEWNRRHPRSPALRATPSEGMTEAKLLDVLVSEESKRSKPKKPKTIVDGALKTLISKGRSEDEAIADLKKEIDRKFYTESEEITETLKRVNGKWALVSRQDPKKVLQYYHGSGHPSKEWISKVERRVHSFSEDTLEESVWVNNIFPDGPIRLSDHLFDRKGRLAHAKITEDQIIALLRDAVAHYGKEIADLEPSNFYVNYKNGLGIGISKVEMPDGSYRYNGNTAHPFWYQPNRFGFTIRNVNEDLGIQKPKVFIDMDGVLADFFGEWAKLDGKKHWKDFAHIDDALDLIRKHPTFWTNLPLLPHAKELVNFVHRTFGEYYICSKPLEGDPRSATGKRAWLNEHFQSPAPARVLLTADKAKYAMAGGIANILIDDYPVNIDHWREAGGIGILYEPKNFAKVKKILKGLIDDQD